MRRRSRGIDTQANTCKHDADVRVRPGLTAECRFYHAADLGDNVYAH